MGTCKLIEEINKMAMIKQLSYQWIYPRLPNKYHTLIVVKSTAVSLCAANSIFDPSLNERLNKWMNV